MAQDAPVALVLFSNDLDNFLPSVEKERQAIEEALERYHDTNRLKVIARTSVSAEDVFRLFNKYRGRIALFHFAGHATGQGLQLNQDVAGTEMAQAAGLAELFGREVKEGMLQFVFLNGCSTNPQLELLRAAGVPSVISTYHPIEDQKAIEFARQLYRALANTDQANPFAQPTTIGQAFETALAYLKTIKQIDIQSTSRSATFSVDGKTAENEAWTLYSDNPDWTLYAEPKGFNHELTVRLIAAIEPHSRPAQKFMAYVKDKPDWASVANHSDSAQKIIAYSYVGVLGIQLRKVFAIGKESLTPDKPRKYLDHCIQTAERALQLLSFTLLSRLWDTSKERSFSWSEAQREQLNHFFDNQVGLEMTDYLDLLPTLSAIFREYEIPWPLPEIADLAPRFQKEDSFMGACTRLCALKKNLQQTQVDLTTCFAAEQYLTEVLATLAFLAGYRMVSIKNVGYNEMRNAPPRYLHRYTALGIDSKSQINAERIKYDESPVTTHAILLYRGRYAENINLFPFVIDLNALTFEGGAKVCFYHGLDISDGSLNYRFLEDNSLENITFQDVESKEADLSTLMMDTDKRKLYHLDFVVRQFRSARAALLPESAAPADFFDNEEEDFD